MEPRLAHSHTLSRRRLLQAGAATGAAVIAGGLVRSVPTLAASGPGTPTPVPANAAFGGLHVYSVGPNAENSTITDFRGIVGAAIVDGTGVAHDRRTGKNEKLLFDSDMRFMQGTFRGTDGANHEGTFAFV